MLEVVFGPPGSGKTTRLLEAVVTEMRRLPGAAQLDAPPVVVLVPEQQALTIEHDLLSRLRSAAGAEGYAAARLKVTGFGRLAGWLADGAGEALPQLDRLGCRLLAWQLLPAGPRRAAQAEELEELLTELAREGAAPESLETCAVQLKAEAPALAARLRELAGMWTRFQTELAARGLAFQAPGARFADLLRARPLPEGAQLFVDGFAGFTGAEHQALEALLAEPGLSRAVVTVLLDPARQSDLLEADVYDAYAPPRRLLHSLLALAARAQRELKLTPLSAPWRWPERSPLGRLALAAFAQQAAAGAGQSGAKEDAGQVTLVECSDLRTEVDFAAREIARLTRSAADGGGGLRYGEVSIVTRSLEGYADLLRARLGDYGIRCFVDRRQGAAHHPAVELLRSGLRLALTAACGFKLADVEDVYALLKCGLLRAGEGADAAGADSEALLWRIENYARELGLGVEEWLTDRPWRQRYRPPVDELDETDAEAEEAERRELDAARRMALAPVAGLAQEVAARRESLDVAALLALAWDALLPEPVQQRLLAAEASGCAAPGLNAGVLQELAALLEQAGLTLGPRRVSAAHGGGAPSLAEEVTAEELCVLLDYGLGGLSAALAPPDQDSVLVTEIERGRHHAVHATFVLGLTQDNWPRAAQPGRGFSSDERAQIAAAAGNRRSPLGQSAAEQCEREPYLALVALTRPSERLYASYPALDDVGRALAPSPYYAALEQRCGPAARRVQASRAGLLSDITQAASPEDVQLALSLSGDASLAAAAVPAVGTAARAWRWARTQQAHGNRWPQLPAAVAAYRGGRAGDLRVSPSRLERFARCPFQHFAHYGLRLAARPEDVFGAQHLGSFYHAVLDEVVQRLNGLGFDWLVPDMDGLAAAQQAALEAWEPRLAALTGRRRSEYVAERAAALLDGAAWVHPGREGEQVDGARPVHTELSFGGRGAELPALRIETARGAVLVGGRIDRLDVAPDGKALIVDYKLGRRSFSLRRFLAGADLQLPLYLLALEGRVLAIDGREYRLRPWQAVLQGIEPAAAKDGMDFTAQAVVRPVGTLKGSVKDALAAGRLRGWLLDSARGIAGDLAEAMLSGEASPLPLRDGQWTACSTCAYRSVCRFDPLAGDRYRDLPAVDLKELQEQLADDAAPPRPPLPGLGAGRAEPEGGA
jgi:ATP-dependent helicase/nuclease subunit B